MSEHLVQAGEALHASVIYCDVHILDFLRTEGIGLYRYITFSQHEADDEDGPCWYRPAWEHRHEPQCEGKPWLWDVRMRDAW